MRRGFEDGTEIRGVIEEIGIWGQVICISLTIKSCSKPKKLDFDGLSSLS